MATAAAVLLSVNGSVAATTAQPADLQVPGPVFQGLVPRAPEPCPPAAEPRDLDPVPEEPEQGFRRMAVPPPGATPVLPLTFHSADTPPNTSTALDDCVPAATGIPVIPPASNPMTSPTTGEPTPGDDQAAKPGQPADIDDPDPSGEVTETDEPAPTDEPVPTDESPPTDEPGPAVEPTSTDEPDPTDGPGPTAGPEQTGEPAPSSSPTPTVTPSAPRAGKPGSAGVGDGYFPAAGNGGYDVKNYDVALGYKAGRVDATVAIVGRATQDLSAFSLDYRGPRVLGIVVNGQPATYRRRGQELVITPPEALLRGQSFTTVVRYSGEPGPVRNSSLGTYGWVPSKDGAITVSEPDGTPTWLPVNDHPQDKATYVFRITVPNSLQVLANGEPAPPVRKGATTTYTWAERSPMASYLAMVAIGKFRVQRGKAGKIPVITAVDPKFKSAAKGLQSTTIAALKWQSKRFGPYPFATSGGIIDDPKLDYALETQERPVYAGFAPDDDFIVHELAHQWFGNSVSLRRWPDIWLNEGFATYAEWLWQEHRTAKAKKKNRDSAKKIFKRYYQQPSSSPIFNPPPGKPGRHDLFSFSVYIRGAMCLQALRQRVGDKAFFRTLRAWTAQRRHRNAITSDFVTLAEKQSGKQLDKLFNAWLYTKGKPKKW